MLHELSREAYRPHTADSQESSAVEFNGMGLQIAPVDLAPVPSPRPSARQKIVIAASKGIAADGLRDGLMGGVAGAGSDPVWMSPDASFRDPENSPAPSKFETNMVGFVERFEGKDPIPVKDLKSWVNEKLRGAVDSLAEKSTVSIHLPGLSVPEQHELTQEQQGFYRKYQDAQSALGGPLSDIQTRIYRAIARALDRDL